MPGLGIDPLSGELVPIDACEEGSDLAVARVAPFAAYGVGPVRIALGVHVDAARMRFERGIDFIDEGGAARIDMDGTGWGFDASAFVRASAALDLGLVYRGRTVLRLQGGADFEAPAALADRVFDQGASTRLTLPDQWVLGARYHQANWALLADLEVSRWSVYDRLEIDLQGPQTPDVIQLAHWGTTYALRMGAEFGVADGLVLRAGLYFDPSAVPDATLSASVPDTSRLGATLGASVSLGAHVSIDGFYQLVALLRRGTTAADALPATYGGVAHFAGIGLRYAQRPTSLP